MLAVPVHERQPGGRAVDRAEPISLGCLQKGGVQRTAWSRTTNDAGTHVKDNKQAGPLDGAKGGPPRSSKTPEGASTVAQSNEKRTEEGASDPPELKSLDAKVGDLLRSELWDGSEDERYDRFTRLVARVFDAPEALILLFDEDRHREILERVPHALSQTPKVGVSFGLDRLLKWVQVKIERVGAERLHDCFGHHCKARSTKNESRIGATADGPHQRNIVIDVGGVLRVGRRIQIPERYPNDVRRMLS